MRYANNKCTYTEEYDPHVYIFTGPCLVTGEQYTVRVPAEELYAYNKGAKIQDAMPSVSEDDREFLISGYSPEGWKAVFGEPESIPGD